jgi:hypothetical protein
VAFGRLFYCPREPFSGARPALASAWPALTARSGTGAALQRQLLACAHPIRLLYRASSLYRWIWMGVAQKAAFFVVTEFVVTEFVVSSLL